MMKFPGTTPRSPAYEVICNVAPRKILQHSYLHLCVASRQIGHEANRAYYFAERSAVLPYSNWQIEQGVHKTTPNLPI